MNIDMKKIVSLLLCMLCVAGTAVSCGDGAAAKNYDDILTRKYDYDLSEYISLADYKGIPASGYRYEITDEMVEEHILATRSYYARLTDVTDRGAKLGDTVYIDYVATIDGEEFEGGSETDCEVVLGAGAFPDELEEAIVGATPESELSVDVTFPNPYPAAPEYSGKEMHFDIHVHNVCKQELPLYNDEFVRGYLGYDSVADFETGIREVMAEQYRERYNEFVISQVWTTVFENTTVTKYPEKEYQVMYDDYVSAEKTYAEMKGIAFPDYLGVMYEMTEDEYYAYVKETVEARMKEEMICYAIARAENVALNDEEYTKRATEYAEDVYELDSLEAFEALYEHDTICEILMFDMAKEAIAASAEITYMEE